MIFFLGFVAVFASACITVRMRVCINAVESCSTKEAFNIKKNILVMYYGTFAILSVLLQPTIVHEKDGDMIHLHIGCNNKGRRLA